MWLRISRHATRLDNSREKCVLLVNLERENHEKNCLRTERHAACHGIKRLQHDEGNGTGCRKRRTEDRKRCGKVKVIMHRLTGKIAPVSNQL